MKVDTAAIDQEIANYEKQLRQHYSIKTKLAEEIDSLDRMTGIMSGARLILMTAFTGCMIRLKIQNRC